MRMCRINGDYLTQKSLRIAHFIVALIEHRKLVLNLNSVRQRLICGIQSLNRITEPIGISQNLCTSRKAENPLVIALRAARVDQRYRFIYTILTRTNHRLLNPGRVTRRGIFDFCE